MTRRLVIIGGGPGGNTAATVAATLGAEVTLIERDVIGGAAHLWDCIPSKAMIATGGALVGLDRAATMGLAASGRARRRPRCATGCTRSRSSSAARCAVCWSRRGCGSSAGPRASSTRTRSRSRARPAATEVVGDVFVVATGSRPRIPEWAALDGERILTTREAYPPPEIPTHLCVIGSGVTGVEFTHMFSALGSEVTLVVSRQQVLPLKDAEVAAVLEDEFLGRGVHLLKGARATGVTRTDDGVHVACDDGRHVDASHVILAIGSVPNTEGLGLDVAGRRDRRRRLHHDQPQLHHDRAAHLRGGRRLGEAAALVGGRDAGPQDRRAPDGAARARSTGTSTTRRPRRRSSPSPRSPTSGSPRPTRSRRAARSG